MRREEEGAAGPKKRRERGTNTTMRATKGKAAGRTKTGRNEKEETATEIWTQGRRGNGQRENGGQTHGLTCQRWGRGHPDAGRSCHGHPPGGPYTHPPSTSIAPKVLLVDALLQQESPRRRRLLGLGLLEIDAADAEVPGLREQDASRVDARAKCGCVRRCCDAAGLLPWAPGQGPWAARPRRARPVPKIRSSRHTHTHTACL